MVFLRRLLATGGGGKITPGISHVLEHIATKFQRLQSLHLFSRSSFPMVVLPISWDIDVRQKSKMAVKLPEVPVTLLVLQIHMSFQKQYIGL